MRKLLLPFIVVVISLAQFLAATSAKAWVPGYLDPVQAGVDQVTSGVLQFWIEVAQAPPLDPNPEHWCGYWWFVDADCNPATGEPHGPVGSEYNVYATVSNHSIAGRGFIHSVEGYPGIEVPMFIDGTKVIVRVALDQIRNPRQFNWNCGASSWDNAAKFLDGPNNWAPTPIAPPPGQPTRVIIDPVIMLREGVNTITPRIRVFNSKGTHLFLKNRTIKLFALQNAATVAGQQIQAMPGRAGLVNVTAMVDGVLSCNVARAMVGNVEITPAIMHLELSTRPTGKVSLLVHDANGTTVPLQGHTVQFLNDFPDRATLFPDGFVQALPAGAGSYTAIRGLFDGALATNCCWVRILHYSVPLLTECEVRGQSVSFWYPPVAMTPIPAGCRFEEMVHHYALVETLDVAFLRIGELTGTFPSKGGMQHFAAVCRDDLYRLQGGSGNPGGCGFDPLDPEPAHSTVQFPGGSPHWGDMLHEIGHEFLAWFVSLWQILFDQELESGWAYSEGFANLCNLYSREMIVARPDHYDVATSAVQSFLDPNPMVADSLPWTRHVYVDDRLTSYLTNGAHYPEKFTADVLDGMFFILAEQYGWSIYPRFFSIFWPPDEVLDFVPSDETQRATFFIAAMSAAACTDLRTTFTQWGLPCDNALFDSLLPLLQWRAAQRTEPAAMRLGFYLY